jgi:hypothetical protein
LPVNRAAHHHSSEIFRRFYSIAINESAECENRLVLQGENRVCSAIVRQHGKKSFCETSRRDLRLRF